MSINSTIRYQPKSLPTVPGIVVPGFINNGGDYYFTEVDIFADGVVDAWGAVDLDFLGRKFEEGWISPIVPDGEEMSIHDVVQGEVTAGQWSHDASGYHERILEGMRQLNPSMSDLVSFEGEDVEIREGIRYAKIGVTEASPIQQAATGDSPAGKSRYAFIHEDGQVYLTSIRIYADGMIDVHPRFGEERLVDLDEFKRLVRKNTVSVTVADGSTIEIDTLGRFEINEVYSYVKRKSHFVNEVIATIDEMKGEQTAVQKCREAFEVYLDKPTMQNKELLKQAYEAVPGHHRMYVGDMDTKDVPIRMVIYGDDEIEGWSHRMVARSQGDEELPTIEVPKPEDE